jgi:hypothetical protein
MSRWIRMMCWSAGALFVALLLGALLVAGLLALAGPPEHTLIRINAVGLVMALLVLLLAVPVAVLLPLLFVALLLAGVLALLAGVAALAFSPVVLLVGVGWLIWRLARSPLRSRRRDDVGRLPDGSARIVG